MVRRGGRSKGCRNCLRDRVKVGMAFCVPRCVKESLISAVQSDEAYPHCSRCIRLNQTCPGPTTGPIMVDMSERIKTERRASRASRDPIKGGRTKDIENVASSQPSTCYYPPINNPTDAQYLTYLSAVLGSQPSIAPIVEHNTCRILYPPLPNRRTTSSSRIPGCPTSLSFSVPTVPRHCCMRSVQLRWRRTGMLFMK
jgi:hypothetical protein